jgi:hypothetical protein
MEAEGKVGAQTLSDGSTGPLRIDSDGALVVKSGGGSLSEAAIAGRLFCAAMQTPTTTSTTLNTTFVGLALVNPTGSGKIIVVHEFSYAATAALTAETLLALATTTDSGFAADITPRCCRNAHAASVAIVDKGATIVAPVIERIIATLGQAADTAMGSAVPPNIVKLDGSIVLDPGRALVTDTTVAAGAVMQFGYVWEEIDI